jgi:hypothetical protein
MKAIHLIKPGTVNRDGYNIQVGCNLLTVYQQPTPSPGGQVGEIMVLVCVPARALCIR